MPETLPYGAWKSPITSDLIADGSVSLSEVCIDGDTVYWLESRPSESGRNDVVRRTRDGKCTDVIPPMFSARTRAQIRIGKAGSR